jgi:hypothetical protein
LPISTHETLYRQLDGITADARKTLARNDFEKLAEIIEAQQTIMAQFGEAGDCKEIELIPLITRLRDAVCDIQQEIGDKKAEILAALKVVGNKQKITRAYGA